MKEKINKAIEILSFPVAAFFIYKIIPFTYEEGNILTTEWLKGISVVFIVIIPIILRFNNNAGKFGGFLKKWLWKLIGIVAVILLLMWTYVLRY